MHRPYAVCVLRGGRDRLRLAFTDTHNNALRLVQEHESTDETPQYRVSTVESAGLLTPRGLCASEDGRYVFLCDTGHHKIKFAALPAQSGLCDEKLAVDGIDVFAFAVLKQRDRDNWSQVDTRSIISLETESTTGTAELFAGSPLKLEENGADESVISNPCQLCGMMLPFDQDAIERVGESLHD
ncbi:hypothetical protein Poli38472_000531 [Pythium oligandrum]|uniref:Uncharacterized protein n=1 Tax=Pythium oligandrum TaxID=41045 RepID=A0A8K1CBT4_PYTOL|nr:hypothetical protein Poli38472_000531 [Pythium oligandrum]|eukprot:TMW60489.1 hypothetical protein Poli38472_000531 [Pythium oligandrum]